MSDQDSQTAALAGAGARADAGAAAGAAAGGGASAGAGAVVDDALLALDRALERATFYPPAHPMVVQARDELVAAWCAAAAATRGFRVLVAADRLGVDGDPVRSLGDSPRLASLARILHELDVTHVTTDPKVARPVLESLLGALIEARAAGRLANILSSWSKAHRGQGVELGLFDAGKLRFAHRGADADAHASRVLSDFVRGDGAADASSVAQFLTHLVEDCEGLGVESVRGLLRAELAKASEPDRDGVARRFVDLFDALPGAFRDDLLRLRAPEDTEPVLLETLRRLPRDEAVSVLLRHGTTEGHVASGTVNLMNRFIGSLPGEGARQSQVMRILDAPKVNAQDLEQALGVLLRSEQNQAEYLPDDYARRIEALSRDEFSTSGAAWKRFGTAETSEQMRLRTGAIAALACEGASEEDRGALFARVHRDLPVILREQRWEIVERILVTLAETPEAGQALRAEIDRRETVAQLLRDAGPTPGARRLLRSFSNFSVVPELVALVVDPQAPADHVRAWTKVLLADYDGSKLSEELELTLAATPSSYKAIVPLIVRGTSSSVRAAARRMTKHRDGRVRLTIYSALVDRETEANGLRLLGEAICDSEPAIVAWAAGRLAADAPGRERLADHLANPELLVDLRVARRLVKAVAASEPAARVVLAAALDRYRKRWAPRVAHVAGHIARRLHPHRDEPAVGGALRRWRFSRARLVTRVLPAPKEVRS